MKASSGCENGPWLQSESGATGVGVDTAVAAWADAGAEAEGRDGEDGAESVARKGA